MVSAFRRLIRWLLENIMALFSWLWGQFSDFWNALWFWIGDWASAGAAWLRGLIPEGVIDLYNDPLVGDNIKNLILATTYFIPIIGLTAIVLGVYGMAAIIRLIRWVKSFIPSISG